MADGAGSGTWGSGAATQSDMETATNTVKFVTPAQTKNHPGVAKAWAYITYSGSTPVLSASYNVASISEVSFGSVKATFTTAMSSANYAAVCTASNSSGNGSLGVINELAAAYVVCGTESSTTGGVTRVPRMIIIFGDA